MKRVFLLALALIQIEGFSQNGIVGQQTFHVDPLPAGSISGQVLTSDNQPAEAVTILIRELGIQTLSDERGFFSFRNLKEGIYTLRASMVGILPLEREVRLSRDGQLTIQLSLKTSSKTMDEVVIRSGRSINARPLALSKINIDPMDLPQSISSVSAAVIREQQAQRLSEVIRNVNGVYVYSSRGAAQETFGARGYNFSSTNLFKNGSRLNSGTFPEMGSLDRVEVLKGSAAILFGQVAPGGVVNMVTKQPKFNWGGEISFRAGSFDLYKPSFDVYGPLSKSVAFRINGSYESANSFRKSVESERYYINPSFLFRLSNKTELVLEGDYLKHDFTPDFGLGTLNNREIPKLDRSTFLGTPWQYSEVEQATSSANLKHRFNEAWSLQAILSYQVYDRNHFAVERILADSLGEWTRPLGRALTNEKFSSAQVFVNGKFNTGRFEHNLLAGIDGDRCLTKNTTFSFDPVTGLPAGSYDKINILDPNKYSPRTDVPNATSVWNLGAGISRGGIYVQDLVKINPKLNLLAGIRYTKVYTNGIDSTRISTGAKTKGAGKEDAAITPRFGLVYKPSTTTSVFLSYASSFVVNTGRDLEGAPISPSTIDQYEVGVKNELFNGALSLNVTAYRIQNNNLAQTAPFLLNGAQNTDASIKVLSGETKSDGVELDIFGRISTGFDIIAGYSYNYARFTETEESKGSNIAGERLVNQPTHTANASLMYNFSDKVLKGLRIGAGFYYVGERMAGWNNTKGQAQQFNRQFKLDPYSTLDLQLSYTFKKISFQAKVSNVTNSLNYIVHEGYSVNPIPPTQITGTLSYKF